MSQDADREALGREVRELRRTLESLQRELEPGDRRRLRPPSVAEVRRFTAEVSIPAAILVLETNVRVLRLLQRAIDPGGDGATRTTGPGGLADGAAAATRASLASLESALSDVGEAVDGRTGDDDLRALLDDARSLRTSIDDRLAAGDERASESVPVDVEAELSSIRAELDDEPDVRGGEDGNDDRGSTDDDGIDGS